MKQNLFSNDVIRPISDYLFAAAVGNSDGSVSSSLPQLEHEAADVAYTNNANHLAGMGSW